MSSTKATGDIGEQLAAEYLQNAGYTIIERNVSLAGNEVDIIAEAYLDDEGRPIKQKTDIIFAIKTLLHKTKFGEEQKHKGERTVIFCEVKRRQTEQFGSGAEAVTPYKMGRYVTAAKQYLAAKGLCNCAVRFDVIEVGYDDVHHIVGAFVENDAKYPRHRNF